MNKISFQLKSHHNIDPFSLTLNPKLAVAWYWPWGTWLLKASRGSSRGRWTARWNKSLSLTEDEKKKVQFYVMHGADSQNNKQTKEVTKPTTNSPWNLKPEWLCWTELKNKLLNGLLKFKQAEQKDKSYS